MIPRLTSLGALGLLALAAPGSLAAALVPEEGPLGNETFVPVSDDARAALARGDRALLRARIDPDAKTWADTFDAWRSALTVSEPGEQVPPAVQTDDAEVFPDPGHDFARRTEGIAVAVLRRLTSLTPAELSRWTERFAALGDAELDQAGTDPVRLARVERDLPATRAAALAALRLADLALEEGRTTHATWTARGSWHARRAGTQDVLAALERRTARSPRETDAPEAWEDADELRLENAVQLAVSSTRRRLDGEGFDRGLLQGACWLDDGRVALQHPVATFLVDEAGVGPVFKPERLLDVFGARGGRTFVPSGQAWPLGPVTDGEDLFFVLGRAIVPGNSSTVCRVTPPSELADAATLRWAISTAGHVDAAGVIRPLEELLEPGVWEFQPGPVLAGSRLLVQARQWIASQEEDASTIDVSNPRAWLVCLDAATGLPVWSRFLAKGTDVQRDLGSRFVGGGRAAAPAQPLTRIDDAVFCGTGLGVGVLVDVADGRVAYSFKTRRRSADDPGWVAAHAPHHVHGSERSAVLYAPGDSDHLYWLRDHADLENEGLLVQHPFPIGGGRAVLGGEPDAAVVLGSSGPHRTISELDPEQGRVSPALNLRPTETFQGQGVVSRTRALFATDRSLYLFDRTRDLYLLQSHSLRAQGALGGGSLLCRGDRVCVIGSDRVFFFRAE